MANVIPVPIVLNNAAITIGTDNYEAVVSRAELVPTTPVVRHKGIGGSTIAVAGTTSWVLNLDWPQDHATANSLDQYAITNAGTVKTITLKPKKGAGAVPTYTIDVLIVPGGPIGGTVDSLAVASASWECNGQPVRTVV